MNDRKGTALVTIFLILFFVLLVILGLLLLTIETRASNKSDEGAKRTYTDAQASVALLGLLRQPFPADLNGDGKLDAAATTADALAISTPALDETIERELRARLPSDTFWSIIIYRPAGTWRIDAVDEDKFPDGIDGFQEIAGRASIKVANDVTVALWLQDANPISVFDRQEVDG